MSDVSTNTKHLRIGIDLGGTKIEFLAMDAAGNEVHRHRVPTPRFDYDATLHALAEGVALIERKFNCVATVGVGIPGTLSAKTGLVKNANSTWLNGRPLDRDLAGVLQRPVRCANDANCLAVSEATDGGAAGKRVVFAVIVGTGCGGGIAFDGRIHSGMNGVAGEWGHNPLPWCGVEESPGPRCYCGRQGCIETWISGTGLVADHERATGLSLTGPEIVTRSERGDAASLATLDRFENRLARGLAHVVNLLDPDVIVLGGGVSQVSRLYENIPPIMKDYVFGGESATPVIHAQHGDSSGVRGAAWLWPLADK